MKYLLLLLITLSACSNGRMYQLNNEINAIYIESGNTIADAEFYKEITQLIHPKYNCKYLLKTNLEYKTSPLIIKETADIISYDNVLTASYKLLDKETDVILLQGSVTARGDYTSTTGLLAGHFEKDNTNMALAHNAANQIYYEIILFFNRVLTNADKE